MRFGVSGHQHLPDEATEFIERRLLAILSDQADLTGISSLAGGADQVFARNVVALGGHLEVVIPSAGYEDCFTAEPERAGFEELRHKAADVTVLPYPKPGVEAFLAAGLVVVERCQHLIAIWDGEPSRGLGGTADVINYARRRQRPVTVLWPDGVVRT